MLCREASHNHQKQGAVTEAWQHIASVSYPSAALACADLCSLCCLHVAGSEAYPWSCCWCVPDLLCGQVPSMLPLKQSVLASVTFTMPILSLRSCLTSARKFKSGLEDKASKM